MSKLFVKEYFKLKDYRFYFQCCQVVKLLLGSTVFTVSFETMKLSVANETVYIMHLSINLLYKLKGRTISYY